MKTQRMVAACAAAIVLAACSASPDANESAPDSEAPGSGDGDGQPSSTSSPDEDEPASPLAEFLGGAVSFSGAGAGLAVAGTEAAAAEDSPENQRRQREIEQLVADCMAEQGFDYIPREPGDVGSGAFDEAFSLSPEEFAREYGYGISTLGELESPAAPGNDDDPNNEIREGLSTQTQEAYDKALWGDLPAGGSGTVISSEDESDGPTSSELEFDGGCYGDANEQVFSSGESPDALPDFEQFASLFDDLSALHQRIQNDPRLDEPRQTWADCMAGAGFPGFDTPERAMESVLERMNELYDLGDQAPEDGYVFLEPSALDPEKLAEVKDYEIGVAVADYECRDAGYAEAYQTVQFELEQEFVDQHRDELERYRDAFAGATG